MKDPFGETGVGSTFLAIGVGGKLGGSFFGRADVFFGIGNWIVFFGGLLGIGFVAGKARFETTGAG